MSLAQTTLAGILFTVVSAAPALSGAQQWNDPASRALVTEAASRRALQLADTGLVDYSATAKGFVTFLAQLGEGFTEPPKIVRADQLALEIYWRAPNLSKQRVYARRDTLLMPTDITYHRDHLGIIQNNFPGIIRLGDGDEVQDVPHPLSDIGLDEYDFAVRDSLQIRLGPRTLNVYEIRVRPKNPLAPRAVGAVFIDRESHDVVRMAFSFTRAALKDKDLDDVSVVLENGLYEGRFWLPRSQEIEIRRSGTWLDFPARGIIRGRWEICCYQVNKGLTPGLFAGPEIIISEAASRNRSAFTGSILDSLPSDVRAVSAEDVRKVQDEARALVRAQALTRTKRVGLSGRRISDFARFNRVEGLALGGGILARVGSGFSIPLQVQYGFGDHKLKGSGGIAFERASGASVRLTMFRQYRDVSVEMERSGVINSLAAQEFGSDYTNAFDARGGSLRVTIPAFGGLIPSVEVTAGEQSALEVHANPVTGGFRSAFPAASIDEVRAAVSLERPNRIGPLGFEIRARATIETARWKSGCCDSHSGRITRGFLVADFERPIGAKRLVLHMLAGTLAGRTQIPAQYLFFLGGGVTAPGYEFHSLNGRRALSQRMEFRFPVRVPSLSLGRYGRTPRTAPVAPYLNVAGVAGGQEFLTPAQASRTRGWFPSVGIGILPVFEMVRLDVAHGLRDGRWTFSVDLNRDFWGIL